jgi:thioredoxin-like negative regulator of GroEL
MRRARKGGWILATVVLLAASASADDLLRKAADARDRGDYDSAIALLTLSLPDPAAELMLAETLGWAKRFRESEERYRSILTRESGSRPARLGLARVILWQGRYEEARGAFEHLLSTEPDDVEALEGHATAAYWSGDLRTAARELRRVLQADPGRESARSALGEIAAMTRPSQRMSVTGSDDDQPLAAIRTEVSATFFSDPLTRWTALAGRYQADAGPIGTHGGGYVTIQNETTWRIVTAGGSLGWFEFPDGAIRPVGSAFVEYRSLTLRVDQREELATAAAFRSHPTSRAVTLRWARDRNWVAAAEAVHRRYFDGNSGRALVGYVVAPLWRRGTWTLWGGASAGLRDTDESRFAIAAVSSTFNPEEGSFEYRYRGEYDPYWSPDDWSEARVVMAVERRHPRGTVKLHVDGGAARDRGRAFGPASGAAPLPAAPFPVAFDRNWRPWRAGLSADYGITSVLRLEMSVERSVSVDYRATNWNVSLVRRH